MINVLEVQFTDFCNGGVENFLKKNIKYINKKKISVDYLCLGRVYDADGVNEITKTFNKIYFFNLEDKKFKLLVAYKKILQFMKTHSYDIVHIHTGNISGLTICAMAFKHTGVKNIICHIHSKDKLRKITNFKYFVRHIRRKLDYPILHKTVTEFLTCSMEAAKVGLGEKFIKNNKISFFPNAIIAKDFAFNENIRNTIRAQYNIDSSCFVIGNIGRLQNIKNQAFLIDLYKIIQIEVNNSRLLLVGNGPEEENLKNKVKKLGLNNNIIFTGSVQNPSAYLQAMDVFVLPSLTEGFPITLIEAQTSGIHCVVSSAVTRETNLTNFVDYLSLDENIDIWIDTILKYNNSYERKNSTEQIAKAGFDLESSGTKLNDIYFSLINE